MNYPLRFYRHVRRSLHLKGDNASELDRIIPAEIKDDPFYWAILRLAQREAINTVLEIGSSAGDGSTQAFVEGMRVNPNHPKLFCIEISLPRFTALRKKYAKETFVRCYNISSVALDRFPSHDEIIRFYDSTHTSLNQYSIDRILGWLDQDIRYLRESGVKDAGIDFIKRENKINFFDIVLIDGSEFTGKAELEIVYGAKYLLLDDINAYKNYDNFHKLFADETYSLVLKDLSVRNGFAIFKRRDTLL